MMAITYLERLATLGTGRLGVDKVRHNRGRLILYPSYIGYDQLVRVPQGRDIRNYFVEYEPTTWKSPDSIRMGLRLLIRLIRMLPCCDEIVFYRCHEEFDALCAFMTAIVARLAGIPVILRDYSFNSTANYTKTKRLYSMIRRVELGDNSGMGPGLATSTPVSVRITDEDLSAYRGCTKNRPVPSVLVYGDFDDSTTRSLVGRAYDLVKQKYPRTEFQLVALAAVETHDISDDRMNGSYAYRFPRSDEDMQNLFAEADMVLLVSPGGINRHFISRARAAGFPVIVNGMEYADESPAERLFLPVPRGSYTGLADAIISLVDDDAYYRSFRTADRA